MASGYVSSVMFVAIIISSVGTQSRVTHLHSPPKRPMSLAVTWREIRATLSNPSLIVLLASGLFGGVAELLAMRLPSVLVCKSLG